MDRRIFLKTAAMGAVLPGAGFAAEQALATAIGATPEAGEKKGDMLYRTLGSTGVKVSAIGLGGYHIGVPPVEEDGIKLIRTAIDRGINFMDNSWDYHNGGSEVRMGKALRDGYRDKVFLMTKIDGRTKAEAMKQLDECLKRLQTDRIDLMQHHEMIRFEDADRIFAPGGAQEALLDAKKAGKIRFIGFTGHKNPAIHLHTLEMARANGFHFDTVQMPLNVMDAHFRSFTQNVLPVLVKEKIGVLGMKSMGSGAILRAKTVTAAECLRFALSLPTSVVITGFEKMEVLEHHLDVVAKFQPLSTDEKRQLLARTLEDSKNGKYEAFKTTAQFDATAFHPEWLG